jgi:hypothetical protein
MTAGANWRLHVEFSARRVAQLRPSLPNVTFLTEMEGRPP